VLNVKSTQSVKAVRLDYMLSNGACIVTDNLDLEGESFDVPSAKSRFLKYGIRTGTTETGMTTLALLNCACCWL
jgi:hypothetical protein